MTHTYSISGMTCGGCEAKVSSALLSWPGVNAAAVSKDTGTATITMDKHISLDDLQKALGGAGSQYKISALEHSEAVEQATPPEGWFETYKPVLLIFLYILLVTGLVQLTNDIFSPMQWMRHFMAGFFLSFSFFKMLDLRTFADSYSTYDIVAKRIHAWGYIYAFVELALGLAYAVNFEPRITNSVTFIVMSISIIGVLQSVLNKKKIQCACLGAVFKLPMSTVTIIEDLLMILMSGIMLLVL
ncbi:MAG TPA: MauE/DoxX family redox-associated membrane protein [Chitinophagaceae bacterium]|nr:MauE/DoxX family redox-associated membrane protein [Chitinophagaceae bacterium]